MGVLMDTMAVLVTKHGKYDQIAPALATVGWNIEALTLDTDALGTFAGDVPRRFPPLETARRKALLGTTARACDWFVASEGTIAPWMAGIHRDDELVVLVHRSGTPLIVGRATSFEIRARQLLVTNETSDDDIIEFCHQADLGSHHLVVVDRDHRQPPRGALGDLEAVMAACRDLRPTSPDVIIQTDLRAHLCPSRQPTIAAAANDLATRLATSCPRCKRPGFGAYESVPGLACRSCGTPTHELRAWRHRCPWCSHDELVFVGAEDADPAHCERCNP